MELDVNDRQRIETMAIRGDGNQPWFVHIDDWQGDLNGQDIRITDKNGKVLFVLQQSSLEQAAYICSMNNIFYRAFKNDSKNV